MAEPHTTNGTGGSRSYETDKVAEHVPFHDTVSTLTANMASADQAAQALLFAWGAYHTLNDRVGPDNPELGTGAHAVEFLAAELWAASERIQSNVGEVLGRIHTVVPDDPCSQIEAESTGDDDAEAPHHANGVQDEENEPKPNITFDKGHADATSNLLATEDFARSLRHLWKAIGDMEDPAEKADAVKSAEFLAAELHNSTEVVRSFVREAREALQLAR